MERLPCELIQDVVLQVNSTDDLRSLARVSKLFQNLAEPRIYRHILVQKGVQARKLAEALRSRPVRATWIRNLQSACHIDSFDGLPELTKVVSMMTKLESLGVETPDCNSVDSQGRLPWIAEQVEYNKIFWEAAHPNADLLSNLRSCTLHFVDKNRSLYSLGHASIIFLHPTITDLTISCANIDPPEKLHHWLDISHTTPLTNLNLVECDIHPEGLYHLLRLPRNLTSLAITEAIHYAFYFRHRRYLGLKSRDILHPIAILQPNLRHLRIGRLNGDPDHLFCVSPLDMTPFTSLQTVDFVHVQKLQWSTVNTPNWCDLVHRAGPRMNTGGPNTTALTYADIPRQWWANGLSFFTCAFSNKVSHGIDKLQTLKLILIDDEILIENEGAGEQEERKVAVEEVKTKVRELGVLGRKANVGIRVVVEWVRPNGTTIPPYLTGEYEPEIRLEYDSGLEA